MSRAIRVPPELRDLPRTTLIALGVVAANLLILAGLMPMALEQADALEADLSRLRADVRQTRMATEKARDDIAFVEANTDRYLDALDRGLFEPQDRLKATAKLDDLYIRDYLAGLTYEFSSQSLDTQGDTTIVTTPLRLTVDTLLDRDIYAFMQDLERSFPGVLVLKELHVVPRQEVTDQVLAQIRAGTPVPLFSGELLYDWRVARGGEGQR